MVLKFLTYSPLFSLGISRNVELLFTIRYSLFTELAIAYSI